MKESMIINYGPGVMTLLPDFIPAPASMIRKTLKWAEESDVNDATNTLLEWCAFQKDVAQRGYALYDKEQKETLRLIEKEFQRRADDRALLQRVKDKKSQEANIIRTNIQDGTRRLHDLGEARRKELSARNSYQHAIDYIERNEELIKRWENQKKRKSLTSPTGQ